MDERALSALLTARSLPTAPFPGVVGGLRKSRRLKEGPATVGATAGKRRHVFELQGPGNRVLEVSIRMADSSPNVSQTSHIENAAVWSQFRGSTGLLGFLPNYEYSPVNFRAAHSSYFEVMGDRGLLGFLIFIAILVNTFD